MTHRRRESPAACSSPSKARTPARATWPADHRVPENGETTETLRNPRSGFVAYVPKGSIKKGESLATRGQCHSVTERISGLGPVPGIAGRSPTYMVRQMYDMQHAMARAVSWKRVVAPLSVDDMLNLAAYAASRTPRGDSMTDMGTFRIDVEIENPASPGDRRTFRNVLVDTGAELSWFPAESLEALGVEKLKMWHFRQANGTELSRWTGGVSVYVKATELTLGP